MDDLIKLKLVREQYIAANLVQTLTLSITHVIYFPFQLYTPKRVLAKREWALFNRPQIFVECDTSGFYKTTTTHGKILHYSNGSGGLKIKKNYT